MPKSLLVLTSGATWDSGGNRACCAVWAGCAGLGVVGGVEWGLGGGVEQTHTYTNTHPFTHTHTQAHTDTHEHTQTPTLTQTETHTHTDTDTDTVTHTH